MWFLLYRIQYFPLQLMQHFVLLRLDFRQKGAVVQEVRFQIWHEEWNPLLTDWKF